MPVIALLCTECLILLQLQTFLIHFFVMCVQLASTATGLETSAGAAITFETAVNAIATLRNTLGGTTSSSVENDLYRTTTAYTSSVNTTSQPDLFAVDTNAVAFTRTPKEVGFATCGAVLHLLQLRHNT